MIKNDRQLKITTEKLNELREGLERVSEKYSSDKKRLGFLSKGYLQHIKQLEKEIEEYEKMKRSPLPKVLHAHNPIEISHLLVRLRLARGLTQAQLAARLGCKQADISRLEREDYDGYTISTLEKIASILNADLELNLIPASK